jgi:hypothetical protein
MTRGRFGRRRSAISAARHADAPSYMLALPTSSPNSIAMSVWNSKIACSVPWLTSGWYGV